MRILILFLVLIPATILGQVKKTPSQGKKAGTPKSQPQKLRTKISAVFNVKDTVIQLRWAPANVEGWRMGNLFGYVVERHTIIRNRKMLDKVESYRLYGIVPDSLKYWDSLIQDNDNAAVMAQALYGDDFSLDLGSKVKVPSAGASMLGKAEEEKQRYLFAMYAADLDFRVAEKAALAFIDKKAKTGEKYFYRIYPAAPKEYLKSDTAFLFVSLEDTTSLPKTAEIVAEQSNKSVVLSWDIDRTKQYYSSFFIEKRTENDSLFLPINSVPFTNLANQGKDRFGNAVVFTDTGLVDGQKYSYRVRGKTIFDEVGPWSDTISITAVQLIEGVPGIQGISIDKAGKPWLKWYFEDSIRVKLKAFEVVYSPSGDGEYTKLLDNVNPSINEVEIPDTLSAGYLMVRAVGKQGLSRTSFPYLYQPEDSIPPASPTGVRASVDSLGVVTIRWNPNAEKDLLGYKVFRSIQRNQEKSILVDTVWHTNEFRDTLNLSIKNRRAFYTVTALDARHNQSKHSEEITVLKPDRIPPTSPVFADFSVGEGVIQISWINSSDEDLKETQLQRCGEGSSNWKTVFTALKKETVFNDKDVVPQKRYNYRLFSIDSSNLRSADAQVLNVAAASVVNRKAVIKVDAQVDREKRLLYVNWQVQKDIKVKSVEVFRGSEKEGLSLYKVLSPSVADLIESDLIINTKYKYGIRVQYTGGEYSEIVIKEINY